MEIEYQDIITLSDENKYVVASKGIYNNSKYAYLVDINDTENLKFVEIEKDGALSVLDSIIDEDLIKQLLPLFYNNSKYDVENMPQ